ncbi:DMT family transporter [Gymnodinialimonas ceratoperidinii]|uniref:DMT family transporter n=1 Tax=Gymnodinialimonas ceratoperidinii TaxID=2856823 RepID=A0A8F6TSE9_9RHOB|nr:DMT family transporter [Gymnodinialimonas ceratoperidinii]QXT38127.1 DMT family transporter [Gymnodinialimonas ceratoperidinii]
MSKLSDTSQGIILMLAAIFLFSAMDATAKVLMARFDVLEVVWARYAGQMFVVALILLPRLPSLIRTHHLGLQLLRSAFLFGATWCFFTSLSFMEIASATAVMNIHPVLLTLGAALLLRERLGPRRIVGIALALTGALIIIRPGGDVMSWSSLLPLGAGICYASYALTTRFLGRDEPILTSFLYTALIGTMAATALVIPVWEPPAASDWGIFLFLGIVGAAGQFLLIQSLSIAEAGAVAPFGYAGVVYSTFWGLVIFAEVPDAATIVGALVIVGAGVYVWHREKRAVAVGA